MTALAQVRANVQALLEARREDQKTLAFAMGKHPTTINKFLKGTREVQLADLDAIADFFGVDTYQLFQPGISRTSERRRGQDRRSGTERRQTGEQRLMRNVGVHLAATRAADAKTPMEALILQRIRDTKNPQNLEAILQILKITSPPRGTTPKKPKPSLDQAEGLTAQQKRASTHKHP